MLEKIPGKLREKLMLEKVPGEVRGKLMLEKVPGGSAWKTSVGKSALELRGKLMWLWECVEN